MSVERYFKFRKEVAETSLKILRHKTKQVFASKLDSRKLLLTKNRFHRDWRGLAEKADLETSVIRSSKISYTEHCFHLWIQKGGAIIQDLWTALEIIDRFDVIEDTLNLIYEDYDYALSNHFLGIRPIPPIHDEEIHASLAEFDSNILTTDDQKNLRNGGTLQFYDALVIFADEDLSFVEEMVRKLEGEYNLKLCLKERDLIGGLAFELSALIRLIQERCARVIVVLSSAFLKSEENKFITQFSSALSVDQKRRILIPCMLEPVVKPAELSFSHSLDYFRTKGYWDYWEKLAQSIKNKYNMHRWTQNAEISRPTIVEISETSSSLPSYLPSNAFPAPEPRSLPSSPVSLPPVSSSSSSQGLFSRFRRKPRGRGEKVDKRKHFKSSSEKSEKENKNLSIDSGLYLSLPDVPLNGELSDSKSTLSVDSRSPTSSTFSTSPLLEPECPRRSKGALRGIFKKVKNFKKEKEMSL